MGKPWYGGVNSISTNSPVRSSSPANTAMPPSLSPLPRPSTIRTRLSRRTILMTTETAKGVAQVATVVLLVTGSAAVWNVALLQMVFGVANAFARPTTIGLVKETVSDAHLQQANALLQLTWSTISIASPAIGALIVALGSPAIAIGIDAVTFFTAATLIASIRDVLFPFGDKARVYPGHGPATTIGQERRTNPSLS